MILDLLFSGERLTVIYVTPASALRLSIIFLNVKEDDLLRRMGDAISGDETAHRIRHTQDKWCPYTAGKHFRTEDADVQNDSPPCVCCTYA